MTTAPQQPGQLIAVTDNHLEVHASIVGLGVLCDRIRSDVARYTTTWTPDTSTIDCDHCITALQQIPAR